MYLLAKNSTSTSSTRATSHSDWSEKERVEAGGTTTSPERMVAASTSGGPANKLITDMKVF